MIVPTVGRVVLFHPAKNDYRLGAGVLAAIVAQVNGDTLNLGVFDGNGASHARQSVPLVQDDAPVPEGCYCEWMPYQKGQAAKVDDGVAKLAARVETIEAIVGDWTPPDKGSANQEPIGEDSPAATITQEGL